MAAQRTAVVLGGAGALGSRIVARLRSSGSGGVASRWRVASVDLRANQDADFDFRGPVGADKEDAFVQEIKNWAGSDGVHAVICAAGGFGMGGIADGSRAMRDMWEMNACSAFTAAHLATLALNDNGLLVLTGAKAAREGRTGFAAGYGMAKAATHHLAEDVAAEFAGSSRRVVCILPGMIDTSANREAMPDVDRSSWTSPDAIADRIADWAEGGEPDSADGVFVSV